MRREEYLHTLTEQIRCKMARGTIEQEINDHIEDQKAEFLSEPLPFLPSHPIPRPIIPSVAGIPYLSSRLLYQIP